MISLGLSWKQALGAVALGNILISWVMVLNGYVGAKLHTSFSVNARSSFGFWFSVSFIDSVAVGVPGWLELLTHSPCSSLQYFPVVSRVVLATVYCGTKTYTGSEAMYGMLRAIWPQRASHSFARPRPSFADA
jgi:NCS1 family nucleobase:cation symporter-1